MCGKFQLIISNRYDICLEYRLTCWRNKPSILCWETHLKALPLKMFFGYFCCLKSKSLFISRLSFTVKTTLIKLLLGYYNPVEGDIRVGGDDL